MSWRYSNSDASNSSISSNAQDLTEAISFINKRAGELVSELIQSRGREAPPFLAKEFAPLVGVRNIVRTNLEEQDGILLRTPEGYIIQTNANHHEVRQNFSCAHEIGHIILDEFVDQTSSIDFRRQTGVIEKAKERLCDIAAVELLMPAGIFKKYLSGMGLSIDSVESIAHTFKVSILTTAIRIAEVSSEPCIVIMWKLWQKRKTKCLRIAWVAGANRENRQSHFIPRDTCITKDAKIFKAYETDRSVKSFKHLNINNQKKRCYVESKGFGFDSNRYVISLVFLNR